MIENCAKCGKVLRLGVDGICENCGSGSCWECWVKASHECPVCGNFNRREADIKDEGIDVDAILARLKKARLSIAKEAIK